MSTQPRSAGTLQVGRVHLIEGIFTADMMFTAAPGYSVHDGDTVLSALLSVKRAFMMLLHQNGIWRYEAPTIEHKVVSKDGILFVLGIKTHAGGPEPIKISTGGDNDG